MTGRQKFHYMLACWCAAGFMAVLGFAMGNIFIVLGLLACGTFIAIGMPPPLRSETVDSHSD